MSKIAGNDEVLRDEMIHLAHRAAHPDRYPLREALLKRHGNSKRAERARDYVCDINCCQLLHSAYSSDYYVLAQKATLVQ